MIDNALLSYLESYLTAHRKDLIERVLAERTKYLTIVLEDIFQSQNASAILRSAECCGIQDIHIIENRNQYTLNPDVLRGSDRWLTINKYNSSEAAVLKLKENGYRIITTVPSQDAVMLPDLDLLKGKCAIVFGTERTGISSNMQTMADEQLSIPMVGFTESFNVSVSAAIVMYMLSQKLRASELKWQLDLEEYEELKIRWVRFSIRSPEMLEKFFYENMQAK
jgi:tRNA (guanosine-2'-O-)-methyltransferase